MISNEFISQNKAIVQLITKAVSAERIYLLGSTVTQVHTNSIFATNPLIHEYLSCRYVLVLVKRAYDNRYHVLQDKIENCCRDCAPVTAIVLDNEQYHCWISAGHKFATKVHHSALCLYNTGDIFPVSSVSDQSLTAQTTESYYNAGMNKVGEFLAGADLYKIRAQNKMAVFMLHQATEHALHTLLKDATGLYLNTHNLDRLMRYCAMVTSRLADVFDKNKEQDNRLLRLLKDAYVHSRYKDDYAVKSEDITELRVKVGLLETVVKEISNKQTDNV